MLNTVQKKIKKSPPPPKKNYYISNVYSPLPRRK
jgi:hypothetical protein